MNLLTFIAPLAVAATFMMPADAANHKELPALGNTHIQVFDKSLEKTNKKGQMSS